MVVPVTDEAAIARGIESLAAMEVHSMPAHVVAGVFGMDLTRQSGKRILDVGAGASNLVAVLRAQGAEAWGLDVAYEDMDAAIESGTEVVQRHTFKGATIHHSLERTFDPRRRFQDEQFEGGALQEFVMDAKAHPEHYISGTALDLPFDRNELDRVVMHDLLSSMSESNRDFTTALVLEALRPLRRGGVLNIGSFYETDRGVGPRVARVIQETKRDVKAATELAKGALGMTVSAASTNVGKEISVITITRKK